MRSLRRDAVIAFILGVLSMIALLAAVFALGAIWRGKEDLALEWWLVRASIALGFVFHLAALASLRRLLRADHERP